MTRRLILVRHAKSSWANPALRDRMRPLKPRGRRDAGIIGRHLAVNGLIPERLLVSPAVRARETARHLLRGMSLRERAPRQTIVEDLYEFDDPRRLRRAVAAHGGRADTLMVIAHNEALHELAVELAGNGPRRMRERLAVKFPTAAVAVIELPVNAWHELAAGVPPGRLVHHVRPKDLRGR